MDNNQQNNNQTNRSQQRYSLQRKPDGSIVVTINIPSVDVEKTRRLITDELVKNVEVQGFRKGAAPRHLAEQKLNKQQVQEEVVRKTLSDEYTAAVKQLKIRPIINPRVHIEPFEEGTGLSFTAETCEEPQVVLGNYKDEAKKIKSTPVGPMQQGQAANVNQTNQPADQLDNRRLDQILNAILSVSKIQIPKILRESEADRLLSQLLDELKRLGVSLDQYLASRQKTAESLRSEYEIRAEQDLKLEFILRKIADTENIKVEEPDVKKAMEQIKNPEERQQIMKNPYMVAAIIRQQKTLDFLSKL